ncbi:MAG: hypothetical protein JSW40_10140 [Candidatus Omnitrophota bacterium]|nr:MAG: hypothetical protein JSW40_10140 [Candidatus Omnitrophota bacterium]
MDKGKIIPIIFLIIIAGLAFVAFRFYSENQELTNENEKLKKDRATLIERSNQLKDQYNVMERQKKEAEKRYSEVKASLDGIESERDEWRNKYEEMARQRDELVEQLQAKPTPTPTMPTAETPVVIREKGMEITPEEYWADFVRAKAELEAKLNTLNKELFGAQGKMTELEKTNKELSIKIDQLANERERLENEIAFKKRTIDIMSRDLVSERESRKNAIEELNRLRSDNVGLKRELIVANKEKLRLQRQFGEAVERKEDLETRIAEIDNILREKSIALEELQEQLAYAVKGQRPGLSKEAAFVELPPIVVKPDAAGIRGLRGEVIAVNREERFLVVDIGESSGVRPGLHLKVLRGNREIGTIEIIETRREISAADIKEVIAGFTVQEGDIVISK